MNNATVISGYQIYHGFLAGSRNIALHREYLNRINVFPVPDGDTGNNMVRTIGNIAEKIEKRYSASEVFDQIAKHALRGSRGNSGIILSQYLNEIAERSTGYQKLTTGDFGSLLFHSVPAAYTAMENPQEGTLLTVIRSWAEAVYEKSRTGKNFIEIFSHGYERAKQALKRTPEQLEVLKENKVPDAGAWGFVSFLEGVQRYIKEGVTAGYRHVQELFGSGVEREESSLLANIPAHSYSISTGSDFQPPQFRYCTEVFIDSPNNNSFELRSQLKHLGDSLIVAGGKKRIRIHIHTNNPEQVVKIAGRVGSIREQKVDDMLRQEQAVKNPLGRIAVLTDSIADIPLEEKDRLQIHVLHHSLLWDDDEYLDRLTLSPDEFYMMQSRRESNPTSAVLDIERIEMVYSFLLEHYDGIIVLPVAKELSGSWQQFSLAAKKINSQKKTISVIDTCLNSAAQGLLVQKIAQSASEDKNLDQLVREAEELKSRTRIFVAVDTLKYMVKGGRVPPVLGKIATLLNMKPVISLNSDGRAQTFGIAFSNRGLQRRISRIIQKLQEESGIEKYCIVHAGVPEKGERFKGIIQRLIGSPPQYISEISPIVGMHSGKGAVAIGVMTTKPSVQ